MRAASILAAIGLASLTGGSAAAAQSAGAARSDLAGTCRDARESHGPGRTSSHTSINDSRRDEARWTVSFSSGACSLEVRARGELRFNRDVTDLESVASGGYFEIETDDGDLRRRLEVRPEGGGLERLYYVNGRSRDFDAEGRAWLAVALVELDRRTAFAAKWRVPRILEARGVDGVLDEISRMTADYARRIYFTTLLDSARLDPAAVRRALTQVGRELGSDYERAELLIAFAKRTTLDDAARLAYTEAADGISSDYEHRRALSALLETGTPNRATVDAVLRSATRIGSDYELATLLIAVTSRDLVDDATRAAYFGAVATVDSDYEQRRALSALLARKGLSRELVAAVVRAGADGIASDYELATLLVSVAQGYPMDDTLRTAYLRAVDTIGSDHEHRRAMSALENRAAR
ncbi:MAG: hypothetical protein WKG32_03560 [Gemmatimonadaceae bacterium]